MAAAPAPAVAPWHSPLCGACSPAGCPASSCPDQTCGSERSGRGQGQGQGRGARAGAGGRRSGWTGRGTGVRERGGRWDEQRRRRRRWLASHGGAASWLACLRPYRPARAAHARGRSNGADKGGGVHMQCRDRMENPCAHKAPLPHHLCVPTKHPTTSSVCALSTLDPDTPPTHTHHTPPRPASRRCPCPCPCPPTCRSRSNRRALATDMSPVSIRLSNMRCSGRARSCR